MNIESQPLSVIFWTSLLRKEGSEFSYTDFLELFIQPAMSLLYKVDQPRINDEMKKILQLSEKCKMGDWFLYEKHTELRIFGSNLQPYKLPKYLTIRVFALEYLRQVLNSDAINFMASKKKTQFKLKNQIGPFIVNNRDVDKEIEKRLSELKFQVSFLWNYDP